MMLVKQKLHSPQNNLPGRRGTAL